MYNKGAGILFTNVEFDNNFATSGGGFTFILNSAWRSSNLFSNIDLKNNYAILGGGIYFLPPRVNIGDANQLPLFYDTLIENNFAEYGGGIYIEASVTPPHFTSPTILRNNTAQRMGGGLFINSISNDSWMSDAEFSNKYVFHFY